MEKLLFVSRIKVFPFFFKGFSLDFYLGLHGWMPPDASGHVPKVHCHERALYFKSLFSVFTVMRLTISDVNHENG